MDPTASIWFYVVIGFQLYHIDYLGRNLDVNCTPEIPRAELMRSSVFDIGFTKYVIRSRRIEIAYSNQFCSGGPAGLVYQFLLCWIGTASVFACLSELASM